jgi:hypothetical protein
MKRELKVGERVSICGWDSKGGYWDRGDSTVVGFDSVGVIVERNGRQSSVHPRQCRRLIKKPKPAPLPVDAYSKIGFAIGVLDGLSHQPFMSDQQIGAAREAAAGLRSIPVGGGEK